MRSRSAAAGLAFLALALAPAASVAQVFKWTDDQGQVHYSDHAPAGQTGASVALPKVPKASKPVPTTTPQNIPPGYSVDPYGHVVDEDGNTPQYNAEAEAIRKREEQAGRDRTKAFEDSARRSAQARADAQAAADKALIAQCRANHETYCSNNADKVREGMNRQNMEQYSNALSQHDALMQQGISTPRPSPPPFIGPRTKVCQKGGKKCVWQ